MPADMTDEKAIAVIEGLLRLVFDDSPEAMALTYVKSRLRECPTPAELALLRAELTGLHGGVVDAIGDVREELYEQAKIPGQDRAEIQVAIGALGRLQLRLKRNRDRLHHPPGRDPREGAGGDE